MKTQLTFRGVDEWDRVVFKDDEGKRYACVFPLWDGNQKPCLDLYMVNLHTVTDWGEPDQPVNAAAFELKPYVWE